MHALSSRTASTPAHRLECVTDVMHRLASANRVSPVLAPPTPRPLGAGRYDACSRPLLTLRRVLHAMARFFDLLAGFSRTLIDSLADLLGRAFLFLATIKRGNQGARGEGKADDRHESGHLNLAISHACTQTLPIPTAHAADGRNALRPPNIASAWSRCLPDPSSLAHLVANDPAHGRATDRADTATA